LTTKINQSMYFIFSLSFFQELYTYNVREGDYFVLDEKVRLGQQLNNKSSRVSRSNSTNSSCGTNSSSSSGCDSCSSDNDSSSFSSPGAVANSRGYTSLLARSGQPMPPFGGHSPTAAGGDRSPARRERRHSSGSKAPPRSPATKNLFCKSSSRRFGEFHHSKVFHDHETTTTGN
jgi:hypothetical protein